ncbi:uncharacterized protein LOC132702533 [Cylas formicarius]|uniref:uncharacterized protein LOC132702533 n=1 Tax=Cylas formicarius TaxID=197179 RepID=UPI002958A96B|nr:uncharacterized protein LOC132702533 [Cylas formicarius]
MQIQAFRFISTVGITELYELRRTYQRTVTAATIRICYRLNMAGKGKKKKPKVNKNGDKNKKKGPAKPKKSGGRKSRSKSARCNVDIFTEAAMENAYATCHNVQDLLKWRGFPWPDGQKKKKKGKK